MFGCLPVCALRASAGTARLPRLTGFEPLDGTLDGVPASLRRRFGGSSALAGLCLTKSCKEHGQTVRLIFLPVPCYGTMRDYELGARPTVRLWQTMGGVPASLREALWAGCLLSNLTYRRTGNSAIDRGTRIVLIRHARK